MEAINLTLDLEEVILIKGLLYDDIEKYQKLKKSGRHFTALDSTMDGHIQLAQNLYDRMAHIGYGM